MKFAELEAGMLAMSQQTLRSHVLSLLLLNRNAETTNGYCEQAFKELVLEVIPAIAAQDVLQVGL